MSTVLDPEQRLDIAQVETLVGAKKSWVHERRRDAQDPFPDPAEQGHRRTRWRAGDVIAWLQRRSTKPIGESMGIRATAR